MSGLINHFSRIHPCGCALKYGKGHLSSRDPIYRLLHGLCKKDVYGMINSIQLFNRLGSAIFGVIYVLPLKKLKKRLSKAALLDDATEEQFLLKQQGDVKHGLDPTSSVDIPSNYAQKSISDSWKWYQTATVLCIQKSMGILSKLSTRTGYTSSSPRNLAASKHKNISNLRKTSC